MHRATPTSTATDSGDDRLAYGVPAAAKLIGISARRTWDLVREGAIRSYTEGKRRLISRRALEDYVDKREAQAQARQDAA